ncbi:MAG: NAD(+) diphosphatase [Pseudorhodobacter sp.]|nr:NAD(+) diphosphatase [Frankiaceae bacterium]
MKVPALSRATVDRDAATRDDPAALDALWEAAKVLVVDAGQALLDGLDLLLLDSTDAPEGDRFYLGLLDGQAYFAVPAVLPRKLGTQVKGLRDVGAVLSDRDAGLMAHAVGLANWHAAHPRCPRCGSATTSVRGGAVRRCGQDGSEHFPRTDPAVIMLVTDGADRCVLGRQAIWPAGRFSTLAGFVEPGESAEMAVVREVLEETGVAVRDVAYRGSQPWPLPASLMLGYPGVCHADADPVPADGELEDARWFTRDELRDGDAVLPPPVSIAHRLITEWLDDPDG